MDKSVSGSVINEIQVAVGIVANGQGQLLIAKRPEHWLGGGFWEFPGGKIEKNEDSFTALRRELLEEVGIIADQCTPLIKLSYTYPERRVILHAWRVQSYFGKACGLEGQEICWCYPHSLNNINMLPANRAIVVAVQLPETYLITPDCLNEDYFLNHLESLLQKKTIRMMQLRSKNLLQDDYINLARKVIALCHQFEATLLLNTENIGLVDDLNADGIHLRTTQLLSLNQRPLPSNKWVSASCHNTDELFKAEELELDFVTISPIHQSLKSPVSLGWKGFDQLVSTANIPVFAQGGMTQEDIVTIKNQGGQGIAAIRGLWDLET